MAVMHQDWCNLTFLHWRYPVETIAARVPAPLTVDTFDGSAWVAVTPFVLSGVRPPLVPALPWISRFPETNCRTYVRAPDGSTGIWFFSLDAARALAVAGARLGFGLPYAWSKMRVEISDGRIKYQCTRKWPDRIGGTNIEVEYGEPMEAGPLEDFLTARWRLFFVIGGKMMYTAVDHEPWPLQRARAVKLEQTITSADGLPTPVGEALVHYSPGVHTTVMAPRRICA